jgi:hypothetical protein
MCEATSHEVTREAFEAKADVVKGGNRKIKVVVHVVCRDTNGQVRFEQDATTYVIVPFGSEVPSFSCESVRAEEVST